MSTGVLICESFKILCETTPLLATILHEYFLDEVYLV